MTIKSNIFYVASEKTIYICWEKIPGLTNYKIFKNGKELIDSESGEFVRPYEFDNDHHTELFKPATRNWLYYKDNSVQTLQKYFYKIYGEGGTTSEEYESIFTEVYTD